MQTGSHGPGAHQGFEFIENLDLEFYAKDAARQAVTMLKAGLCPSGKMPVVIDKRVRRRDFPRSLRSWARS